MVERITRGALLDLIESDSVQVVDVLPKVEFLSGHIPGAINVPLKTIDVETTRVLNKSRPVAVY